MISINTPLCNMHHVELVYNVDSSNHCFRITNMLLSFIICYASGNMCFHSMIWIPNTLLWLHVTLIWMINIPSFSRFLSAFNQRFCKGSSPFDNAIVKYWQPQNLWNCFLLKKAQQGAFDSLQVAMIQSHIVSYADYSLLFEVPVDASSVALDCVLC